MTYKPLSQQQGGSYKPVSPTAKRSYVPLSSGGAKKAAPAAPIGVPSLDLIAPNRSKPTKDKVVFGIPKAEEVATPDFDTAGPKTQQVSYRDNNTPTKVAKFVGSLPKNIVQGTARGVAGSLEMARIKSYGGPASAANVKVEGDKFREALFGEGDINPQAEGEALLKFVGAEDSTAMKYGAPLFMGLTMMDFVTGPGKKSAITSAAKEGAETTISSGAKSAAEDKIIRGAIEKYRSQSPDTSGLSQELAENAKNVPKEGAIGKLGSDIFTPISSRLERINPELKNTLRNHEFKIAQDTQRHNKAVLPLLNSSKNMSKGDAKIFDLARKNGDDEVIDAIARKYDIHDELNKTREVLDELHDRARNVGIDVQYRKNYFPRVVKNSSAFSAYLKNRKDWSKIREMIEEHARKKGMKYTDLTLEEQTGIVNNFLRGFGNKTDLSTPGSAKARTIEIVDDELDQFYENTDQALAGYVVRMNDEIAAREFFGKHIKNESGEALPLDDSIGSYVLKLMADGKIRPDEEEIVSNILKARFSRGKMNGALDAYRHVEYISTMGSPISAVTQIGDLAFSLYNSGFYHTFKGMAKVFRGKKGGKLTREELGVEQIAQEFSKQNFSGKVLDKTFKLVGLDALDKLGKETLVNSHLSKLKSQAKRRDPKLIKDLQVMFDGAEIPKVLDELAEGSITPNTKLIAFNRLLDFQPVAKSEMPVTYLKNPNGRIFYMLKSFTIKQFDVFRREAIDKLVSGSIAEKRTAMKNLLRLSMMFVAANATADEIKDFMLGRDTPPSDRLTENVLRLFGATRFDIYKAQTDGAGTATLKKILFPTSLFDSLVKDGSNMLEEKTYKTGPLEGERYKSETVQRIPGGGKLYYWWLGRGAQKEQYDRSGSDDEIDTSLPSIEGPEMPELPKLPSLSG